MARSEFGGTLADSVTNPAGDVQAAVSVTFWNAPTGGTQHTDLREIDGTTVIAGGIVTTDSDGAIRRFYGPDGVTQMWAQAGSGTRRLARSLDSREQVFPTRRVRYVDQVAGSDSNTGTSPGKSFATIQAAVDALGADGGKVLVHDGVYAPFTLTTSGVEVESIGGRRKTVIRNLASAGDGITVQGASALSTLVQTAIRGFTIAGPGKAVGTGRGIAVKWVSVDFCVEDCWVTSWGSHGIYAEDSYSATVRQTLIDQCGGDGFNGVTNINNWTFDRTISILNNGNGYAITGGTSCLFLNADAESNVKAGFDLRYVFAPTLLTCHMEKNGSDGTSPNVYLHYRTSTSEKTTAANVLGCIIQGSATTTRGLVIDGATRTTYQGNWFAGHVTEHVQTTSNADRTWVGPNTYSTGIPELTDGSASTVRMDYDATNLCARTDVLRLLPRSLNPAVLAQGQTWWSSTTDQFKARGASDIRTVFAGYQATATLDFPSIAAGTVAELTVTVTGAVAGDSVTIGPPVTLNAGLMASGFVSAANTVTVRVFNGTAAAVDPVSAGWKVNVIRS